ncbi:MAG: hypothetical protein INF92_08940 [Rhodobacter sp.]|nr:hypothetical protein [Rhodobacter sp.]
MPRARTPYAEAQLQRRLWTPDRLRPALWLDAADRSTITIATGVSEWRDKSGNNRHLSQTTPTQQPALTLNAQNGLPALTFDGSNDFMSNASVGAAGLDVVQIISVFRMITGGANEDVPMGVGQTGFLSAIRTFYRENNGTTVGFASWGNDVASSAYSYDIGGNFHVFEAWNTQRATPNQIRIGRNGSITTYSVGSVNLTADGFSVGSLRGSAVANYYSNIAVGEILVAYSEWSQRNRQLVEGYLGWKWGITLDASHPFVNRPPLIGV